ncbi:MAG: trypsin-like peptidase domain-containing protein, partial [Nitrospiraceae bacterium]|nr:trypsin-like peptidase domain-containing protein [Nitrospiraceae bacterium]
MAVLALVCAPSARAGGFPAEQVYSREAKSVVLIVARDSSGQGMLGSGSVISSQGLIITNAHVVVDKATRAAYPDIRVYFKPREVTGDLSADLVNWQAAKVQDFDSTLDLAVLKVDSLPAGTGKISLEDSSQVRIGEPVIAIGHPENGGLWSLTYGRISGQVDNQQNISGKDVFQTDTNLNPGNSGGPLLDRYGFMVGINSNIARRGEGGLALTGINFAIKASVAKKWLRENGVMVAYGKVPAEAGAPAAAAPRETISGAEKDKSKTLPQANPGSGEGAAQPKAELSKKPGSRILTPIRPYSTDQLWKQVSGEMEDMMNEMKQEIK